MSAAWHKIGEAGFVDLPQIGMLNQSPTAPTRAMSSFSQRTSAIVSSSWLKSAHGPVRSPTSRS
jgi:hypothetical protein